MVGDIHLCSSASPFLPRHTHSLSYGKKGSTSICIIEAVCLSIIHPPLLSLVCVYFNKVNALLCVPQQSCWKKKNVGLLVVVVCLSVWSDGRLAGWPIGIYHFFPISQPFNKAAEPISSEVLCNELQCVCVCVFMSDEVVVSPPRADFSYDKQQVIMLN